MATVFISLIIINHYQLLICEMRQSFITKCIILFCWYLSRNIFKEKFGDIRLNNPLFRNSLPLKHCLQNMQILNL